MMIVFSTSLHQSKAKAHSSFRPAWLSLICTDSCQQNYCNVNTLFNLVMHRDTHAVISNLSANIFCSDDSHAHRLRPLTFIQNSDHITSVDHRTVCRRDLLFPVLNKSEMSLCLSDKCYFVDVDIC